MKTPSLPNTQTHQNNTKQLLQALIKAKQNFKPIVFDTFNPHFKSKYASLKSVIEATQSALSEQGLLIVQQSKESDTTQSITTTLFHESGESIAHTTSIKPEKNTPQAIGSAITYARRYGYVTLLGLYAEDDDANQAQNNQATKKANPKQIASIEKKITTAQKEQTLKHYKIGSLEHLTHLEAQTVIARLTQENKTPIQPPIKNFNQPNK